ncbi:protein kinase [Archangium violaceum]|uniref:serine/threonine-protein kinase n=1 Tax=Archangium violaceum TaxID=83451 RepID=UPI00193BEA57|nr:serine/threonine-protein kinase [Archangium violaceum]QRK06201.1 protein kinase [Archangium violaceum]
MSPPASRSCPSCGNSLPPGAVACPLHGPLLELPEDALPTAEDDALVGQRLGEYRVLRCIGRGGMGVVYEAEHVTIGRRVALKLLREDHARSPHARNLLAEARAAGSIQHRGIIDVFGIGQEPGIGQYLVMEYLEGEPLSHVIARCAPLPPARVVELLGEVLDALSAAHARGVIHRDLKPSNIFVVREVDGTELVKVLDFGLAKHSTQPDGTASQTRSDLIVGTPHYMAPEQALSEAVSPRTDLYAVGVIAFEMLTGRRPFPGRSSMEIVAHHLKSPAIRPSSYVVLPHRLDDLVLQLLAKEPWQRPGSASEVAREMRALLQEQEGPGSTSGKPSPSLDEVKPAPALAFLEDATLQGPSADSGSPSGEHQKPPVTPTPMQSLATPTPMQSLATPTPLVREHQPPPARGARWSQGLMAGGLLVLSLGGVSLLGRGPSSVAPVAQVPAVAGERPAPAPADPLPAAVTPEPEPRSTPEASSPRPEASAPAKSPPLVARKTPRQTPARVVTGSTGESPAPRPAVPPARDQATREPPVTSTTGTLYLTVKGAWAHVWVDGEMLGRVPPLHRYVLTAGEHELELRNPGIKPHRQKIVISPSETLTYTTQLEPLEMASPLP